MQKSKPPIAILLAGVTAMAAWFAVAGELEFVVTRAAENHFTTGEAVGRLFSHGTTLVNLLVAIALTIIVILPQSGAARFFSGTFIAGAIALYILVVLFAYNILMRGLFHPAGRQEVDNELLHVVVPVFYFLYWFFFVPKSTLKWKHIFLWLIGPALYFTFILVRGAIDGFYPYTFLYVADLGYGQVIFRAALSGIAIIGIGLGLVWIGKYQTKKP